MGTKIDSVTSRDKLTPKREPYWHRIIKGCFLGYRKMSGDTAGAWVVRTMEDDGGKKYKSLGSFNELPDHLRFDAAVKAAQSWIGHIEKGGTHKEIDVAEACKRLIVKYRHDSRESAAIDAEGRFKRWVYPNIKFSSTPLLRLTAGTVSDWRNKLARTPAMYQDKKITSDKPRAASTLNRDMAVLKTALNLALEDGFVTTALAWSVKLKPVKNATGRRDLYLDPDQRRALIEKAASDVAILIHAMCFLPLRPGAVAALTVRSFDKRLDTLTIGKDKSGKDRKITLPKSTAAFFTELAKDKLPGAPLCARADGRAWDKDAWKGPFKAAVIAAGLPKAATAYSIRHSTITDLISLHRLDAMSVAVLSGTSVAMIEKHYLHLIADRAAAALESLAL